MDIDDHLENLNPLENPNPDVSLTFAVGRPPDLAARSPPPWTPAKPSFRDMVLQGKTPAPLPLKRG